MKIALASYENMGRFGAFVPDEDEMILSYFSAQGHDIFLCVWDDPEVEWNSFDAILIKSTWDYFIGKIDAFYTWLDHIKSLGIPCFNEPQTIRWNADKHYLLEIEAAGLPIVPTLILEKNTTFQPELAFENFNTEDIVLKPTISGGAMNTLRLNINDDLNENTEQINEWLREQAYLVQPLKNEIIEEGEWSFVYFKGVLSHSLLKSAKAGEFRVQHFFGGSIEAMIPSEELLQAAQMYINKFAANTLYARVDGVLTATGFELMELELIEPYLFFFTNEHALANYYNAFIQLYEQHENNS